MSLLFSTPLHAQDRSAQVDEIFSWATQGTPGCAVAALHEGEVVVNRAYGSADIERDVPLSPSSIFDIGSVQKQFTAASILLLVDEGRLSLSDDVRKYVPELPDYGHTITLDHLLTHTSGLRDWSRIAQLTEGNPDVMTMVLRQRGLDFAPGEEWAYSSSGYVLLKEIVARTSGMSFSEFTRTRLFEPLGMASTQYVSDLHEVVKNRAVAYEGDDGRWKIAMRLENDRGAVLSTARDLLLWGEALSGARLGAFVGEKIQEEARLNNGRQIDYARGLYVNKNRGGRFVWHSGGIGGYESILSTYPEQGLSIAVLCNSDERSGTMFARRIFDVVVPGTREDQAQVAGPVSGSASSDVAEVELSGRTGLFFSEPNGEPLRLIANNGRLRVAGGPPLAAVTKDVFRNPRGTLGFRSQDEFELHFLSDEEFVLTSMEGLTTRYRRAQPHDPTPADLKSFSGRYGSDEIGAVLEFEAGEDGLVGRLAHVSGMRANFKLVDQNTFQAGSSTIRFERNEAGQVVALHYTDQVLRNVRFNRLSEQSDGCRPAGEPH